MAISQCTTITRFLDTALGVHKALPHVGAGEVRPQEIVRDFRVKEGYNTAEGCGMLTSDALTTSRRLINDSRVLIASAKALISQSQQAMARQRYVRMVCAWCQETIRFARATGTARGQISHSICFACFAPVFGELDRRPTPPPRATPAAAGAHPSPGLPLREHARRAGETDTMANLARYRGLLGHPANAPLAPRTGN